MAGRQAGRQYGLLTLILAQNKSHYEVRHTLIHLWCSILSHNSWKNKHLTQQFHHDVNKNERT